MSLVLDCIEKNGFNHVGSKGSIPTEPESMFLFASNILCTSSYLLPSVPTFIACLQHVRQWVKLKNYKQDFLGGPVVKNLPAISGNTGLIPGPGRFHVLQGS